MDSEDACFEFKQEQDLMHRTHLYYLDYDFSQVSPHFSGQVNPGMQEHTLSLTITCVLGMLCKIRKIIYILYNNMNNVHIYLTQLVVGKDILNKIYLYGCRWWLSLMLSS